MAKNQQTKKTTTKTQSKTKLKDECDFVSVLGKFTILVEKIRHPIFTYYSIIRTQVIGFRVHLKLVLPYLIISTKILFPKKVTV